MIKATSRLVMTAAAAGLAFAPIAANAKTRAADSSATYAAPGEGRSEDGEKMTAAGGLLAAAALALIVGGIIVGAESGNDNQSPGGN